MKILLRKKYFLVFFIKTENAALLAVKINTTFTALMPFPCIVSTASSYQITWHLIAAFYCDEETAFQGGVTTLR